MPASYNNKMTMGWWIEEDTPPDPDNNVIKAAITRVTRPVFLINMNGQVAACQNGKGIIGEKIPVTTKGYPLLAYTPPLPPENLGDPLFKKTYNLRYAYIVGAMANGITSVEMVEEIGRAGMIGFFGTAGLPINKIEAAIDRLQQSLTNLPFGFNLIYNPNDPELEAATVQLYLKRNIKLVSVSAYMDLTLPLVYFRVKGIHRESSGNIVCPNKVISKVSRTEVARKFFSPPPEKLLTQLINQKIITKEEAALASSISMAEDLTAEADSGGHTDNSQAISLLPTMLVLRDEMAEKFKYQRPPCVGLAGGIATPEATAAAFAMGAAYVLTGSVNQSCVEAGTSGMVRQMLAEAKQADVTMAPAADMFEMGVKVQVLKRGTMFPLRAAKLYDLYCKYDGFETIPEKQKTILERDFFSCSFEEEWGNTKNYFEKQDPKQITRAEKDPKHKMALVFRSYLGRSSDWAIKGVPSRKVDYQILCGPAMGAFNQWVKGSFLEKPENRKTVTVAMNLLLGASVVTRMNWLRSQQVTLPAGVGRFYPIKLQKILELLEDKHGLCR